MEVVKKDSIENAFKAQKRQCFYEVELQKKMKARDPVLIKKTFEYRDKQKKIFKEQVAAAKLRDDSFMDVLRLSLIHISEPTRPY